MGFYSELENIRQENTQYALFHINRNSELLDKYIELRDKNLNNKMNSESGLNIAQKWALKNNHMFGDLFYSELELVRWNKLLKLL